MQSPYPIAIGDRSVQVIPVLKSRVATLSADNLGAIMHLQVVDSNGKFVLASDIDFQLLLMEAIKNDLKDISGLWHYFLPSLKPLDEKVFLESSRTVSGKFYYRIILGCKKLTDLVHPDDTWTGYPFN